MIDILPTLALCTGRDNPDKTLLRAWSLVLSSRRFLNRAEGGRLLVAPALAHLAVKEIMAYGVFSTPAVVIDGEVKSVGKVPSKKEFLSWIKPA